MYIIKVKKLDGEVMYFGPFQTEMRALEYNDSLPSGCQVEIVPLIVPNCIGVTFATKY